jgi:hypothetical protein
MANDCNSIKCAFSCMDLPSSKQITCADNRVPYVEVQFVGGGASGNMKTGTGTGCSSYIKSFQYSFYTSAGGARCKLEIIDESGGAFTSWVQNLTKTNSKANLSYLMLVRFGWIPNSSQNGCGGNNQGGTRDLTPFLHFQPSDMQAKLDGNRIRFEVEGIDLLERSGEQMFKKAYPASGRTPISFRAAVNALVEDEEIGPPFDVVYKNAKPEFMQDPNLESDADFQFEWGDGQKSKDGPLSIWQANGRDRLAVIQEWIKNLRAAGRKGLTACWAPLVQEPTMVVFADAIPNCNSMNKACANTVAQFIVNGGNCSTVLSFSPNIRWHPYNLAVAGQSQTAGGSANQFDWQNPCPNLQRVGTGPDGTVISTDTSRTNCAQGRDNINVITNVQLHRKANWNYYSINGELKIVGNTMFVDPVSLYGKTVSLIVINPFYLSNQTPCKWQASGSSQMGGSVCNPLLTNSGWFVFGGEHFIREGSYTTTLTLNLPAAFADFDANDNNPAGDAQPGDFVPNFGLPPGQAFA